MGLRKSVPQQREWSSLPQSLQQLLQQRLEAQPLQIRCATRDRALLVLAEHLLHIEPDPEQTFLVLELEIKALLPYLLQAEPEIDISNNLPIHLFLRIAGYQHPYASHRFRFEPETPAMAPLPPPSVEELVSPVTAMPFAVEPPAVSALSTEMPVTDLTAAQEAVEPITAERAIAESADLAESAALETEIQPASQLSPEAIVPPAPDDKPILEEELLEYSQGLIEVETTSEPVSQLSELPELPLDPISEAVIFQPEISQQALTSESTVLEETTEEIPTEPVSIVDLLLSEDERTDLDIANTADIADITDTAALSEIGAVGIFEEPPTAQADEIVDAVSGEQIQQNASIEPPKIEPSQIEPPKIEPPQIEPPKIEPPQIEPLKLDEPKIEPPQIGEPKIEPPQLEPASLDEVLNQAISTGIESVEIESEGPVGEVAVDTPAAQTSSEEVSTSESIPSSEFIIADPWISEAVDTPLANPVDREQPAPDVSETADECVSILSDFVADTNADTVIDELVDVEDEQKVDELETNLTTDRESESLSIENELESILRKIGVNSADTTFLQQIAEPEIFAPQVEEHDFGVMAPLTESEQQSDAQLSQEPPATALDENLATEAEVDPVDEADGKKKDQTQTDKLTVDPIDLEPDAPAISDSANYAIESQIEQHLCSIEPDVALLSPLETNGFFPEPLTLVFPEEAEADVEDEGAQISDQTDQTSGDQAAEDRAELGMGISNLSEQPIQLEEELDIEAESLTEAALLTNDSSQSSSNQTDHSSNSERDGVVGVPPEVNISTGSLVDERPQRFQWSASNMVLGSAIGSFVLVGGLYGLTRPCVVGSCDPLQRAQQLSQEAVQTAQSTESALEVVEAHKKLGEASYLLGTIPAWSPHYKDAQALLKSYEAQSVLLGKVVEALEKANTAAQRSQNPPHPLQEWREIQWLWRDVIEQLETIPSNSSLYALVQRKLDEYRANLTDINQRVVVEQQAQDRITAARQAGEVASAKAEAAKSAEHWQETVATWMAAIEQLKQIPQGTSASDEAAQLLALYQPKLTEANTRRAQEQSAANAYSQAITSAEEARRLEQQNQWSQAVSSWRNALNYAQQVPGESVYYSQVQPLINSYTQTLQQAQGNSQRATVIQTAKPNFDQACAGNPRICTYTLSPQAVRVQFTSVYDQTVEQLINSAQQQGNAGFPSATVNQVNGLLRTLADISEATQVPIELYNSNGTKLGTYAPTLSGYVPQQ